MPRVDSNPVVVEDVNSGSFDEPGIEVVPDGDDDSNSSDGVPQDVYRYDDDNSEPTASELPVRNDDTDSDEGHVDAGEDDSEQQEDEDERSGSGSERERGGGNDDNDDDSEQQQRQAGEDEEDEEEPTHINAGSDAETAEESSEDSDDYDNKPQILPCLSDTPLEEGQDWKNVVVARIALWGVGAIQALLLQTKDGTESGSAHGSVRSRETVKKSINQKWQMVQQPMGYITRIHGYHSLYGAKCLLHSVRFEFASGQVIEQQGMRDDWKGQEFVVEDLEDNFYISALEFEEGVCVGYRGYSTPKPLAEIMENESEPDMDILNQLSDDEDDENDKNKGNNNRSGGGGGGGGTDDEPPPDNPYDPQEAGGWVGEHLKAKEVPHPETREEMILAYVCLLGRDSLQGAIFMFYDGHREGKLSAIRKRGIFCKGRKVETDIECDVEQFDLRGATWVQVEQPGGRISTISGRRMTKIMPSTTAEKGPKVTYLCHTLNLEFESGQVIKFVGSNNEWKGDYFSYTTPPDYYLNQLEFAPTRVGCDNHGGFLVGVSGVRTYDGAEDLEMPEIVNKKPPCWDKFCCCC